MFENRQQNIQESMLRVLEDRITQHFKPQIKKKSAHESALILSALKNHFIFYNLSAEELENVKQKMYYTVVEEGTVLFEKGTPGSCFFIIERGNVEIIVDGIVKKELKPLQGFGELALLYHHERTSEVRCRTETSLWVIDKVTFREAVQQIVTNEYEQNRKYLENLKFFGFLANDVKDLISASLVTLKFYKNQIIVEQGDPGSAFYIIKEGVASLIKGGVEQRKMYRGQSFGEMSLYYNTMRKMTVKADEQVKCLVLGRETLSKILGDNFHGIMFRNFIKYSFQKNRTLSKLSKLQQEKILEGMKIAYYKANDVVFKKGAMVQKLIILFEGKLKRFKSPVTLASAGETWGEEYLEKHKDLRIQDDIVAESDMVATEVTFQHITKVLGVSLSDALQERSNNLKSSAYIEKAPRKESIDFREGPLEISQLYVIKELGKIHYGRMYLVSKKPVRNNFYIAKVIDKKIVKENSMESFVLNELQVLPKMRFPFIAKFYRSVETAEAGYTVNLFEFINGMELYDVIRDIGLLSSKDCQFYIGTMVLTLEYLQQKEIIIRDLKPENFVVDSRGYLKFVSFGASKYIGQTHKTSTIIGTPHYMAPEMVEGKHYNELADLWSVGVMFYEFINGYLPFGPETDNPYQIYEAILKAELTFPATLKDKRAKKLMEELLSVNPQTRHGGSYANLKNNSWFQTIDWDELFEQNDKKLKPPYIPEKIMSVDNIDRNKEFRSLKEYLEKH